MIICTNIDIDTEKFVEAMILEGDNEFAVSMIKAILDGYADIELDERALAMIYRGVKAEYEAEGETLDIEKLAARI